MNQSDDDPGGWQRWREKRDAYIAILQEDHRQAQQRAAEYERKPSCERMFDEIQCEKRTRYFPFDPYRGVRFNAD